MPIKVHILLDERKSAVAFSAHTLAQGIDKAKAEILAHFDRAPPEVALKWRAVEIHLERE